MNSKKLNVTIYSLFIVTFIIWLFLDMLEIVSTPLSFIGVNHWLPELLLIVCIGMDISDSKKITPVEINIIAILIFLYPFVFYTITSNFSVTETIFGFSAGCIFSGFLLFGVWLGSKITERRKTKLEIQTGKGY